MTKSEALGVKVGDRVSPIPLWNQTEREYRHIADGAEVLAVEYGVRSQTTVMLTVRTKVGGTERLDAGWFE